MFEVHSHGSQHPWLRTYHPAPLAPVRLVCFPHAGGTAGAFHELAGLLAPDAEVVSVQYPGRQDRFSEPCARSIGELADGAAAAMAPLTDRPLALFGHSMGALVAFEVARRCAGEARLDLVRLFVSGNTPPHVVRDDGLHKLDDAALLAQVRSLAGTGSDILLDDDLVELILPSIRADYEAVETYRCTTAPPLDCPIDALGGDTDPDVAPAELDGWQEHTSAGFTSTVFPGGHFYLLDQGSAVAATVRRGLSLPRAEPSPNR